MVAASGRSNLVESGLSFTPTTCPQSEPTGFYHFLILFAVYLVTCLQLGVSEHFLGPIWNLDGQMSLKKGRILEVPHGQEMEKRKQAEATVQD